MTMTRLTALSPTLRELLCLDSKSDASTMSTPSTPSTMNSQMF
jgi:hypothetical protein